MSNALKLHEARFYDKLPQKYVRCHLCPRYCTLADGDLSFCGVRANQDGTLYARTYGYPVAMQIDPIEKKPLKEFLPGSKTFSFGTFGCNLDCSFCQNSTLSRGKYDVSRILRFITPAEIIAEAVKYRCESIAFTYNEPTVFAEYVIDCAKLAHENNLKTVLVSNGYVSQEARGELYEHIDSANIDVKGFSNDFYTKMVGQPLQPVLDNVVYFYQLGKHLELTMLIIPGKNDEPEMIEEFLNFVEQHLSKQVPLHFTAFHPSHRCLDCEPTPAKTIERIIAQAQKRNFNHVYSGNVF